MLYPSSLFRGHGVRQHASPIRVTSLGEVPGIRKCTWLGDLAIPRISKLRASRIDSYYASKACVSFGIAATG